MARKKTLLYFGLGIAAWWYWQKSKGNNIFGQPVLAPVPVTAQLIGPTPAQAVAAAISQPGATINT